MQSEWFECKVRYDKTLENGLIKKVTETYLVDALSFTEAEKRFIEEITPFMSGEFIVTDIKRARISELFDSEDLSDDRWFRARIAYITLDEKTGVEKRTAQNVLIQANDFHKAINRLDEGMKGTLGEWVIVTVTETAIIDVFKFKVSDEPVGENK
ncbi:MAG: DUF4494 domain-containing protein [Bacteroidaceae bacterium]|jgi:hypothetical protein|nr:DUF4494 domain-containing protein [Bacteroidaceae bacterium]MBQ5680920.1 DUF4494 domain-containing protein [Bacteroidaceae bacterium]MBQ5714497.1 DUF4494 domain-containing protein [Bacteroidaceae bacterium]MEE1309146.1 DUF4494 domain-containing protein [Bacteroidaceae bacterium]